MEIGVLLVVCWKHGFGFLDDGSLGGESEGIFYLNFEYSSRS